MKINAGFLRKIVPTLLLGFMGLSATANASVFSPPEGIFVSSGPTTAGGAHSIQKEDVQKEFVAGVLVRAPWSDLEPSPGVYDFSILDNELARAEEYNTLVTLAIVNGPNAPGWLAAQGVQMIPFLDFSDGQQKMLPLLWDAKYLNYWKNFIAALGARYNSHPRIALVHITNATGNGFEMQLPEKTEVIAPWEDVGYSEDNVIDSWQQVIDAFGFAFPDKPLDFDVHPVLRSDTVAQTLVTYANSALSDQFGVFAAWWSQDNANTAYPEMNRLLVQAAAGTFGMVQMVCSETENPGCMGEGGMTQSVSQALQNGIRYLEVWNQDIRNSAFQSLWTQTATTLNALNNKPTITSVANQTLSEDSAAKSLNFTIGDVETSTSSLIVTATSSNSALFPVSNLVLGGSGSKRTIALTPKADANGSATITLIVSDGSQTSSSSFSVTVNAVNDAPTIGTVSNQTINEEGESQSLQFAVADAETDKDSLTVTATSNNTALIASSGITLGTAVNTNRTVKLVPVANQNGTATITLTVSDGVAKTTSSFTVTVNSVNDAPTIGSVSNFTVSEDAAATTKTFSIADSETATSALSLSATSTSGSLISTSNIVFGGSNGSRTVSITPTANKNGTSTITLILSDGTATTRTSFDVTVNAINDAPSMSSMADVTINEDAASRALPFSISDSETTSSSLSVSVSSSNTSLIPTGNISLGGSGGSRSISLAPAANQSGSATITLTTSDGSVNTKAQFKVTVSAVNDKPTIGSVSNITIAKNGTSSALGFTLSDLETATSSLTVSASTSSSTLLPTSNITLGGSGGSRTVTLKPASNKTGTATITLKVSDGASSSTSKFTVTVQ